MPKSKGYRNRTRSLLRKERGSRSIVSPDIYLQKFKINDKVIILANPSVHKGLPHRRYHGKIGRIAEIRGKGYVVEIIDGNKIKKITTRPEHLKLFRG
ncbi:MAG: 50S ribosomal protein L21e [Nitrososphaerota archaeon]